VSVTDADFAVVSVPGAPDCVVRAEGEIDLHTAPRLRDVLRAALAGRPTRLIVDMAEVNYIDSTGLGVLIGAFKRSGDAGSELVLQGPVPRVLRVLELTGLHKVLAVVAAQCSLPSPG
jgi:anti-sigma B factor antagonist